MRTGFHDKLSLYTNSVYATNDLSTASPHTTANTIGGGLRYDHDFSARTFWFVNADFLSNSLQELNLRSTFGGGIGLHAIKTPVTTLDLLAGLNYTHESYSAYTLQTVPPTFVPGRSDSLAGLTLGDAFTHKVGKSTDIVQSFFFLPGPKRHITIPRHFQFRHGHKTQQVAGLAELVWGYLCQQPSAWNKEE